MERLTNKVQRVMDHPTTLGVGVAAEWLQLLWRPGSILQGF
jgi:hypothetical protein